MKSKYLLMATGALLLLGGAWFGRVAWRAHRELVTLDVREVPLADVLRDIEKQTWKKIRAEKALDDVRVTLHGINQPLKDVLNRLAEQAGARWSTLYAVYDSSRELNALDSALRGDGKIESAGWTQIAPKLPPPDQPGPEGSDRVLRTGSNPDAPGPMPGVGGTMMLRGKKDGPVTFSAGGPNGKVEMWSPEELVMESSLSARRGSEHSQSATAESAAETARKVNAKWTTYLAFKKSSMGVGFGGMPPSPPAPGRELRAPNQNPNKRFADLTPEQRVQQARERRGLNEP